MSSRLRAIFLFFTVVAVLLVSAVGTTSAYADDGTPPPPDSGEVTPTPLPDGGSDPVVTETPGVTTDDTGDTGVAVPDGTAIAEDQQPADAAPIITAPILEQLPADTTVTVLNAEGEAQPLATQASADAIESAYDPIWCPEGQSPTPGQNGCTSSFNSFAQLLTFLKANETNVAYQQAGTIFIQQGQYLGGESSVNFNDYNLNVLHNYNLTLHGGWDTSDNSTDAGDTTQFNVPITIGSSSNPWIGSLTLYNMNISNVSAQTGLTLTSQGNITLGNVEVTNSLNGTVLTAGGSVTINDSNFNRNKKTGANINAGGNVQISNTTFSQNGSSSGNTGKGLEISNAQNVSLAGVEANNNQVFGANVKAAGTVTVTDSFFSGNKSYTYTCRTSTASGGYGLQVIATNAVSLNGVTASENYFFGGHLEGSSVEVYNSTFDSNGSGSISNPVGKGLEVKSGTTATLIGVQANNNQLFGANVSATGDVVVNNSFFNGNKSYSYTCRGKTFYGYGLEVATTGNVFVSQIEANENNLFGAHLEGSDVAIFGSKFDRNGSASGTLTGSGLEIVSTNTVSLASVEANNNELFGANIQATGSVSVSNSFFNGHKVYTHSCQGNTLSGGGYGLIIVTDGSIALNTVDASDNYLAGAQLDGADVAITDGTFNRNNAGLEIQSTAGISLSRVKANENKSFGASLEAAGMVSITDSFFNGNKSYVYSCHGNTYDGYGLKVVTSGLVSLSNVTADNNNLFGAQLDGRDIAIAFSSFSNNGTGSNSSPRGKGLEVNSTGGQVSLYAVTASGNQLFGADIEAVGTVFVNNSVFSGNMSYTSSPCRGTTYNGYGLKVVTTAAVYLSTVTANDNNLFGASLTGSYVDIADSSFNSNGSGSNSNPTGQGLVVKSSGDVSLVGSQANNNELFGANIQADGNVTVLSSIFAGNKYYTYTCSGTSTAGYGLKVVATGAIVLGPAGATPGLGVQAFDNGAEGAILEGTSTISVTNSSFHDNGADGLKITANGGAVTLNNVTATGNGGDGVDVTGACTNTVFVNGGTFANNDKFGIRLANIIYGPAGTQIFGGNHSGNVFQSSTCVTTVGSSVGQSGSGSHGGGSWQGWGH